MRPLNNAASCFSSRKAKILTPGIHLSISRLKCATDPEIGKMGYFPKVSQYQELFQKG